MLNYRPLNDNVIIKKIQTSQLTTAGEDQDINAVLTGIVVATPRPYPHSITHQSIENELLNEEVMFIRGQSRQIKLEEEEYFIIKLDKILLVRNK